MVRPFADSSGPMRATLFSAWHATTQAWHPEHLSRSVTIPQRGIPHPQNSKHEIQNPKQARMFKISMTETYKKSLGFRDLNFGFVSDFDIRISNFILS